MSLLILLIVGLISPLPISAQSCQPRPRVGVQSVAAGPGRLQVTVTAGSGALQSIVFPGASSQVAQNTTIEFDGQTRQVPFTYPVAGGATQKSFTVVRTGGAGTPTTLAFTVTDGCGPWNTFVGGGSAAWEVPLTGQVVNAGDGQPLAGATVQVEGTGLTATTGGDGRFSINQVPKGNQSLKTTASGFLADTRIIGVGPGAAPQLVGLHRPSTASLTTEPGMNVVVAPDAAAGSGVARLSVTFADVITPGITTIQREGSPPPGAPPNGEVASGAFFDITTTASFSGPIAIEIPYDPTALNGADPRQLRLMHQENGAWIDRTSEVDVERRVVKGQVNGFSRFTTLINRTLGVPPPNFPIQPQPGSGNKVIFIPGIIFACGLTLIGVPTPGVPFCDTAEPYGTINRGSETFEAIRARLKTTNALRSFSYSESDFVYFAYAPHDAEFRGAAYRGSHTRRAITTSAADLATQLDDWGTDGKTYDIITHSLGGAVAAYWAFTDLNPAHRMAIRSITTLDSPVNGVKGLVGDAGRLFAVAERAGDDLQSDGVINVMQAGARLGRFVTFANTADGLVPPQAALIHETCPKLIHETIPECRFSLHPTNSMDQHSIIHDHFISLNQIDRILAGLTVSGQIVDQTTGLPIGGARIDLDGTTYTTTVEADGRFTLTRVPLGTLDGVPLGHPELIISAPGYVTLRKPIVEPSPSSSVVDVGPIGLGVTTGTLAGTVTDGAGGPGLDGATIQVQGTSLSTTTANGGQFTLTGVPAGARTLVVSAPGFETHNQPVNVAAGTNPVLRVPLVGPRIQRVSLSSSGAEGNADSNRRPVLSADGRYIAFRSSATNLVAGDTNNRDDVFVKDRHTGAMERIPVATGSLEVNVRKELAMSADGRHVAFLSGATNLVSGDTNGLDDIFVVDRQTGVIERSSIAADGTQGNGLSGALALSADGRYVTFVSAASNLVSGDTNGFEDIFVKGRLTGAVERASIASGGAQTNWHNNYPALSSDGRYVAFVTSASNLVSGDTNGFDDIFVKDRQTGAVERVNVTAAGAQANHISSRPTLSADGRYVLFESHASNLVAGDTNGILDVFVKDRQTGAIDRVNVAVDGAQSNDGGSSQTTYGATLSLDGRYVAFSASATNLVADDTNGSSDVFVKDRQTGAIERVSLARDGTQASTGGFLPALGTDGRFVAFGSRAPNLVPGDTNAASDVFIVDRSVAVVP